MRWLVLLVALMAGRGFAGPDACATLAQDEAVQLLGGAPLGEVFKRETPMNEAPYGKYVATQCGYYPKGFAQASGGNPPRGILITINSLESKEAAQRLYKDVFELMEDDAKDSGSPPVEKVAGAGEAAFLRLPPPTAVGNSELVELVKGSLTVAIQVWSAKPGSGVGVAAAKKIAARLP